MKIVLTLDEVRDIVRAAMTRFDSENQPKAKDISVRFIHKYFDGSGETDVELIAEIDRVEIEVRHA